MGASLGSRTLWGLAFAAAACPAGELKRISVGYADSGKVSVTYVLENQAREILLRADSDIRSSWWLIDDRFEMKDDRITSSHPFRTASAQLIPNDRPLDRVYPSLTTIDATTSVVNLDYVAAAESGNALTEVHNAYDPHRKRCVSRYRIDSEKDEALPGTAGRYVLFSRSLSACKRYAGQAREGVVVAPTVSPALARLFSKSVWPMYRTLDSKLGVRISPAPVIMLAQDRNAARNEYQGDVGWDSVIFVRFRGTGWDELNAVSSATVLVSMTHELVHLWIGKRLRTRAASAHRAWLHEGAAQYIALVELLEQGRLTTAEVVTRLNDHVSACTYGLGQSYLMTEAAPTGGSLIYDCGTLVQLVYDAVARAASSDAETVTDSWRRFLITGSTDIDAEEFIFSSAEAADILSGILHGPLDLDRLAADLQRYGIKTELRESSEVGQVANTILMPFYNADCEGGPVGFWTHDDHLVLDANETCRSIPTGFVVRYIEGEDVLASPSAAYRAAADACAIGGSLELSGRTDEEPQLSLECPGPLPPPPNGLHVASVSFF